MNEINIAGLTAVTLKCSLAGYDAGAEQISWAFNEQPITSGTNNYIISVSSMECPPYGTCGLGLLVISDLDSNDVGEYVCSFADMSQTITLITETGIYRHIMCMLYSFSIISCHLVPVFLTLLVHI